jgi:DmsE family decaheme c-type cytochrome
MDSLRRIRRLLKRGSPNDTDRLRPLYGAVGVRAVCAFLLLIFSLPFGALMARGEPPAPPADESGYVGSDTCKVCHEAEYERFSHTSMGRLVLKHPRDTQEALGCEVCHGPGKRHVDASGASYEGLITFSKKDPTPVERRNSVCLGCHRGASRLHWEGSPHAERDLACTACHRVMEEVSERYQLAKATEIETCGQCHLQRKAQLMRSSHMPLREGKMTCSSCHDPHGSVGEHLLKANSINDLCYTCHAEKRGPFLWEHPPVMENCANCHDPHGSNYESLLVVSRPRLCQRCHIETRHPTQPQDPMTRYVFNRGCSNCHSLIHGSNHPSGRVFQR